MTAQEYLQEKRIDNETQKAFRLTITNSGSLSIPILDKQGKLLFHKYRNFKGKAKYLYEKGTSAQLFGIDKIADEHRWVIITEGEMEVITLFACGVPAVSSTGGCKTFKEEWYEYLNGKQVIIMYDNDEAGRDGEIKTYRILSKNGINCSVRHLSGQYEGYKDFGEIMAQEGISGVKQALKSSITIDIPKEQESKVQQTYKQVVSRIKGKDTEFNEMIGYAKQYNIKRMLAEFGHYPVDGNSYKCIFHNEKTGSMVYRGDDNHVYCHGCAKYSDAIGMYQELAKVGFRTAVYTLVDKL